MSYSDVARHYIAIGQHVDTHCVRKQIVFFLVEGILDTALKLLLMNKSADVHRAQERSSLKPRF